MKRFYLALLMVCLSVCSVQACTFVFYSNANVCLAGNNEDWKDPNTYMWFVPGENGEYGRVCFGFGNKFPQGGMNEKGLCWDGMATAFRKVSNSSGKPNYPGNLLDEILATCSTVEEALALFDKYNLSILDRCMIMLADAGGNSAIVEGDKVLKKEKDYQICTNFYQSDYLEQEKPCARYNIAQSLFENSRREGVDLIREVLSAVHSESSNPTQYSNIYDLKNQTVHLYHFHDFEHPVMIDLKEELAKGAHTIELKSIFPRKHAFERFVKK